jgi:hypothetical protein
MWRKKKDALAKGGEEAKFVRNLLEAEENPSFSAISCRASA